MYYWEYGLFDGTSGKNTQFHRIIVWGLSKFQRHKFLIHNLSWLSTKPTFLQRTRLKERTLFTQMAQSRWRSLEQFVTLPPFAGNHEQWTHSDSCTQASRGGRAPSAPSANGNRAEPYQCAACPANGGTLLGSHDAPLRLHSPHTIQPRREEASLKDWRPAKTDGSRHATAQRLILSRIKLYLKCTVVASTKRRPASRDPRTFSRSSCAGETPRSEITPRSYRDES